MAAIQTLWGELVNAADTIGITDIIDMAIVAFLIYELIALVRQTRAAQSIKGILVLLFIYAVVKATGLLTLGYIMDASLQFAAIALVVVFQPELRRMLEQMGRTSVLATSLFKSHQEDDGDLRRKLTKAIAGVCDAVERMSDSRTGALIVFERRSNLSEIVKTGTPLHAIVTPEALGTIFYEGTPMHDGAVVIRDGMIDSAGCFLPLSANLEISKEMGTRHRAALGMSENSDAVIVVVSEETGIVSMAKNGVLIRRIDRQNLYNMLVSDIVPPLPEDAEKKKPFWRRKHEKH